MSEDIETSNLEENLPMVTYIMLHRIYDVLTIIGMKLAGEEEISKMIDYHDKGYLLGPGPSFTPEGE